LRQNFSGKKKHAENLRTCYTKKAFPGEKPFTIGKLKRRYGN
jgi:hypothetical protein